jgi:hypothetical protein
MRKSRDVGPDTHVADVANLMIWENLRDIVPFWLGRTMVLSVSFTPRQESRWWQEELACGHDVMLDMPNELTELLLLHA